MDRSGALLLCVYGPDIPFGSPYTGVAGIFPSDVMADRSGGSGVRCSSGTRRMDAPVKDAIRGVRAFSATLIAGGMAASVARTVTDDTVPIALGAIAAVSGVVLAVFAFLGHRKTRYRSCHDASD